jgi:hypothetical protein
VTIAVCCLIILALVGYLQLPVVRAARHASRMQTYSQIGIDLPRTGFFAWYDREISDCEVWADGLRTYPLLGPGLTNRVSEIGDWQPLISPKEYENKLPDLLVLSVQTSDPAHPGYGRFSPRDSLVRKSPEWFRSAYADSIIRAYFVQSP